MSSKIKKNVKIAITGLQNAGKTSFVQRLISGSFISPIPTLGIDVEFTEFSGIPLQIWDLGGHSAFRNNIWRNYVLQTNTLIYMVDINDKSIIKDNIEWFWKCLSWLKDREINVVFLANKSDLIQNSNEMSKKTAQMYKFENIGAYNPKFTFKSFVISAKSGENIDKAMNWIISRYAEDAVNFIQDVISLDFLLRGKDFSVYIQNVSKSREKLVFSTHEMVRKWISDEKDSSITIEETSQKQDYILKINTNKAKFLLITKTKISNPEKLLQLVYNIEKMTPFQNYNEVLKIFDEIKKEFSKLFSSDVVRTLTCQIFRN